MVIQDSERYEDVEFPEWINKVEQYATNASTVSIDRSSHPFSFIQQGVKTRGHFLLKIK